MLNVFETDEESLIGERRTVGHGERSITSGLQSPTWRRCGLMKRPSPRGQTEIGESGNSAVVALCRVSTAWSSRCAPAG